MIPDPPKRAADLDPLITSWPAGSAGQLYRCYDTVWGVTSFNPGPRPQYRFSFFGDPPIPAWYGATTPNGAVAESIFHDLPRTDGLVVAAMYRGRAVRPVTFRRPLRLVQLDSDGLRRLGLRPRDLTDTEPDTYRQTTAWAKAFHRKSKRLDGLTWMSRQRNTDRAVVLFGDRVDEDTLIDGGKPDEISFDTSRGWEWLYEYATTINVGVEPLLPPD